MFKNMSVSLKLIIGFAFVIVLILVLSIYIINDLISTSKLREENNNISFAVETFLNAEIGHYQWISNVKNFIYIEDKQILDNVQLDHTKCDLGQFIYGEEILRILGNYKQVMLLREDILDPHEKLHDTAKKIQQAKNISQKAMEDIFNNETLPNMKSVQDILGKMRNALSIRSNEIEEELKSKADTSRNMTIIIGGLSILFAVIISILISRSILNTLGGEPYFLANITNKISDGELDIYWGKKSDKMKGLLENMKRMVESLRSKADNIETISDGDFDIDIELASNRDVVGKALIKMAESLQSKSNLIEKIAKGDFTVDVKLSSNRDKVGKSLQEMVDSLNIIFTQIAQTTEDVKSGAQQLKNSSQDLSEGASDQASSLEEVSASLSEISSQVQNNTENVVQASELSATVEKNARMGNSKMKTFVDAIKEINHSAEEIRSIVKIIDDIAFQTNLLALNANIEAARVGKYGKGFAVVADSVRNLATESAESVKETTEQVEKVIKNIEIGSKLADETAEFFQDIANKSTEVNNLVSEVSTASQEQTRGIEQISTALNQVENVVQSNTANAEENASTSVELSQHADRLSEILSKYRFGMKNKHNLLSGNSDINHLSTDMIERISAELKKENYSTNDDNEYEKDIKPYNDDI